MAERRYVGDDEYFWNDLVIAETVRMVVSVALDHLIEGGEIGAKHLHSAWP